MYAVDANADQRQNHDIEDRSPHSTTPPNRSRATGGHVASAAVEHSPQHHRKIEKPEHGRFAHERTTVSVGRKDRCERYGEQRGKQSNPVRREKTSSPEQHDAEQIEDEFDRQRPVHAFGRAHAKRVLQQGEIDQQFVPVELRSPDPEPRCSRERNRKPVSRENAEEAFDRETKAPARRRSGRILNGMTKPLIRKNITTPMWPTSIPLGPTANQLRS